MKLFLWGAFAVTVVLFAGCKWPCCCCHHHDQEETKALTTPSPTQPVATNKQIEGNAIVDVTTIENFDKEVLKATKPVVVDFSAVWCPACKTSKPVFESVAQELGADYQFVTIDVDKAEGLASTYQIRGIPCFVFFKEGKEVDRLVGGITKERLTTTLKAVFGK